MKTQEKKCEIITIPLGMVNVYVLKGESIALVDAGHKQHPKKILAALETHGIQAADIDLIIITHGHVDHIGGLPLIKERTGAKVLIHSRDRYSIEEGRNVPIPTKNAFFGFLMNLFARERIPGYRNVPADIIVDGEYSLSDFGIDATVIPVPGSCRQITWIRRPSRRQVLQDCHSEAAGVVMAQARPRAPAKPGRLQSRRCRPTGRVTNRNSPRHGNVELFDQDQKQVPEPSGTEPKRTGKFVAHEMPVWGPESRQRASSILTGGTP